MTTVYHAAIEYIPKTDDFFFEEMSALTGGMFDPVVDKYAEERNARTIIMYIIYAYSTQSKLIVSGASSVKSKQRIAQFVGLPEYLYGPVVNLQCRETRGVILDYLSFQKDRDWEHYNNLQITYDALMSMGVKEMFNEEGKVNYKDVLNISERKNEMLKSIKEIEVELNAKYLHTIDVNLDEIKMLQKEAEQEKGITSLAVEESIVVKKVR